MLEESEIEKARGVSIHELLGIPQRTNRAIRCPFHNERTPSMRLFHDGHYHCFGCGKHGYNAIDFLMDMGVSFKEAVRTLSTM